MMTNREAEDLLLGRRRGRQPALTSDQAAAVREMYRRPGVSAEDIAAVFRVSAKTVLLVIERKPPYA